MRWVLHIFETYENLQLHSTFLLDMILRMTKINKKQSGKSSTNAKGRSTKFKLPQKVHAFFRPANTTISIVLTNQRLTRDMCADIQKTLKIKEDLGTTVVQTELNHSRHSQTIRVDDPTQFKARLLKCQQKYSQVAFFADYISLNRQFRPLIGTVVGAGIVIIKVVLDMF